MLATPTYCPMGFRDHGDYEVATQQRRRELHRT